MAADLSIIFLQRNTDLMIKIQLMPSHVSKYQGFDISDQDQNSNSLILAQCPANLT